MKAQDVVELRDLIPRIGTARPEEQGWLLFSVGRIVLPNQPPRVPCETWRLWVNAGAYESAALALIPPGWVMGSLEWWPERRLGAGVTLLEVQGDTFDDKRGRMMRVGPCATPALAITAGALSAIVANKEPRT
jgi:hypothetical protein